MRLRLRQPPGWYFTCPPLWLLLRGCFARTALLPGCQGRFNLCREKILLVHSSDVFLSPSLPPFSVTLSPLYLLSLLLSLVATWPGRAILQRDAMASDHLRDIYSQIFPSRRYVKSCIFHVGWPGRHPPLGTSHCAALYTRQVGTIEPGIESQTRPGRPRNYRRLISPTFDEGNSPHGCEEARQGRGEGIL